LTSGSLEALKDLIKEVQSERETLGRSILGARRNLDIAQQRLRRAENWFFGIFLKKKVPERKAAVEARTAELQKYEERLSGAFIDADFGLDEHTRAAFEQVARAFELAAECARIWDVTSIRPNDRKVTRSAASSSVERTLVRFSISEDPVLQTDEKVLRLQNSIGADLLVYPGFVLMQNEHDLALIDFREMTIAYRESRFIEEETVPPDAIVVDHTWAKCNKDGSPDRRFANNYRIPIVSYGEIALKSAAGLNEEYQFSSVAKAERFANALADYQAKVRILCERAASEPRPTTTPTDHGLKSIAFLQAASALSGDHAIKILEQFGALLKAEIDAFSGSRPLREIEILVNELTRVPDAVRSFFETTTVTKPAEMKILKAIKDMMCGYLRQVRNAVEHVEPKSEKMQQLLTLVCGAEAVMRR
jgi:hypothetical protein